MVKNFYRLIQGDCLKVLPTLPNESIDLVLTDPPYNILKKSDIKIGNRKVIRNVPFDHQKLNIPFLIKETYRVLRDGGAFYIFMSDRQIGDYIKTVENLELTYSNTLVWFQTSGFPSVRKRSFQNHCQYIAFGHKEINEKYTFNFKNSKEMRNLLHFEGCVSFEYKGGSPGEYVGHPTQKPSKLFIHLIEISSNEKDVVLDPFLGSGTTMFACQNLKRSCIGVEISPDYCDLVKRRCFGRQFLDREVKYSFEVVE